MKQSRQVLSKIFTKSELGRQLRIWSLLGKKVVFTNGVFDVLHQGHLFLLIEAAALGDILIVGVNSDKSVKRLKGESRPVNDEYSRALLLASLIMTDAIIIFEEDTPLELIKFMLPGILVKGGDYTVDQLAGAEEIINNGGEVKIIPTVEGFSTTLFLQRIKNN